MIRNNNIKQYWIILFCLGVVLSAVSFSASRASAQNTSFLPLEDYLSEISPAKHSGKVALQGTSAITLVDFYVEYDYVTEQVLVIWKTATETDTAGYVIWRSLEENGTYVAVSPFIQAEGGLVSITYEWIDPDVQIGNVYYYKLEEINTDNVSVYFYGPVMFDFFSPTATASLTFTPTPTGTLTVIATTPPTATRTPTRTNTPTLVWTSSVIRTATPSPTRTPVETQAAGDAEPYPEPITGTIELQPLPPFQLMFPEPTATPETPERTLLQAAVNESSRADLPAIDVRPSMTPRLWLLGGIVALLWIVLGSFLVVYLRKSQG